MEHLAIMKKSWGLTDKILDGRKKIESRWYRVKCKPWDNIQAGDIVYFKDSGELIRLKAEVEAVKQYAGLTPDKVKEILDEYGEADGLEEDDLPGYFKKFKDKKYCILIFLKNPEALEPFDINKKGFGAMAAWITTDNIIKIRK